MNDTETTNATSLINDLIQVAPIGNIENVSEEKLKEIGLTPPSQATSIKTIDNKTPLRFHKTVGILFDNFLGVPNVPDSGRAKMRTGEGKLIKNLIDNHNRKLKKYQRKNKFDDNNAYIFVVKHENSPVSKEGDNCVVTIHTICAGANGAKIVTLGNVDDVISDEIMHIQRLVDQKYVTANKVIVLKNMNHFS